MKKLDLNATMQAVQILNDAGLSEKIKTALTAAHGELSEQTMAFMFIDIIGGVCGKNVADRTVSLIAYLAEKTDDELRAMPIMEIIEILKKIAAENNLTVFLKTQ